LAFLRKLIDAYIEVDGDVTFPVKLVQGRPKK